MRINSTVRFILYGLSSVMDMVAGTLLFVVPVRATQLGASYALAGGMGVAWGLGCVVAPLVVGRQVTNRNAGALCALACLLQAAGHLSLILFTGTAESMLPFLFVIGFAHTMFFLPYQMFFKAVDAGGRMTLASSVGVYTFAWSMGMAVGPLWSGFLMRETLAGLDGWQLCFVFTIVACAAVGVGVVFVDRRGPAAAGADVHSENPFPDFAKLSWLAALCGSFAFSLVRGLFPAGAVRIGVPEDVQGGVIFCMGLFQAVSGLALTRVLYWMYRPGILAVAGAGGLLGMLCFLTAFLGLVDGNTLFAAFFAGATLFGLYSGSFYFYATYHCLVHPSRAGFNVTVCEGMHAIANVVGLLLGGFLADWFGINSPYLLAAVFIGVFTALQIWFHRRKFPGVRIRA